MPSFTMQNNFLPLLNFFCMKKVLYTLGLLGGTIMAAQAQNSAIKLNVISVAVATANVSFESKIGDGSSFQIGAFYTGFSISDTKFTGFGITPELRFYPGGDALHGFFVGPYLRYQNFKLSSPGYTYNSSGSTTATTNEATLNTFGGGANLGYQWVFGEHFVLEPFLRLGYSGGSVKVTSGSDNYSTGAATGVTFLPGLNLGYAF